MSTYRATLPSVFPAVAAVRPESVPAFARVILSGAGDLTAEPNSSFAVTADRTDGLVLLWLSLASAQKLTQRGLLNPELVFPTRPEGHHN